MVRHPVLLNITRTTHSRKLLYFYNNLSNLITNYIFDNFFINFLFNRFSYLTIITELLHRFQIHKNYLSLFYSESIVTYVCHPFYVTSFNNLFQFLKFSIFEPNFRTIVFKLKLFTNIHYSYFSLILYLKNIFDNYCDNFMIFLNIE